MKINETMLKFRNSEKIGLQDRLIIFCLPVILVIGLVVFVYFFVDPFPPRRITIGCGPTEGADFKYAQAYREYLSKQGIRLDLRSTAGSVENIKLLGAASGGVDVAFVQGIMKSLANIAVPLSFSEELYHLRMHIDMMRSKIRQIIEIEKINRGVQP